MAFPPKTLPEQILLPFFGPPARASEDASVEGLIDSGAGTVDVWV